MLLLLDVKAKNLFSILSLFKPSLSVLCLPFCHFNFVFRGVQIKLLIRYVTSLQLQCVLLHLIQYLVAANLLLLTFLLLFVNNCTYA